MPNYIALLRAINVGGRNLIAMSDLRSLAESLGLKNPKTLLQSGNLIFESRRKATASFERLLESQTRKQLNAEVDYCVRTSDEWQAIVNANPFPKEAKSDPSHLVVMCLKGAADPDSVKRLQAEIKGRELVRAAGTQLYITYPDSIGTSKLTGAVIERKLGIRGTARNWNTVLKLSALASA